MSLRPWQTFAVFIACALVLLTGVAWISVTAVELDRRERAARQEAATEENVRLALWRMDSAMAPLIGTESARPYFVYRAFFAANRPYGRMLAPPGPTDRIVASPLLLATPPQVILHFFVDRDGLSSPQVPAGRWASVASARGIEPLPGAVDRLAELRKGLEIGDLRADAQEGLPDDEEEEAPLREAQQAAPTQVAQRKKSSVEWSSRSKILKQASTTYNADFNQVVAPPPQRAVADSSDTTMAPRWLDGRLLLVRRPMIAGTTYLQGAWLDWPEIRASLLAEVRDLLPNADLVPRRGALAGRGLASLPVELLPGAVTEDLDGVSTSVILILGAAWFGVLLAAAAVAALLVGATALGERRADFVSAVTHELRTPLTTFRMYTEMLADGMVRDEAKRTKYLDTLRRESIRLSHLVENVLSYARIERGSDASKREDLCMRAVIERFADRLEDRASQAGMQLTIELPDDDDLPISADGGAIEQVLFNLVDNACKYGCSTDDRNIELSASRRGQRVLVKVRDHGPGVSAESRRRLFSPFSKSAERAATSAPGVGLGLALSRRLARAMGGDLALEPSSTGATFVLTLASRSG